MTIKRGALVIEVQFERRICHKKAPRFEVVHIIVRRELMDTLEDRLRRII